MARVTSFYIETTWPGLVQPEFVKADFSEDALVSQVIAAVLAQLGRIFGPEFRSEGFQGVLSYPDQHVGTWVLLDPSAKIPPLSCFSKRQFFLRLTRAYVVPPLWPNTHEEDVFLSTCGNTSSSLSSAPSQEALFSCALCPKGKNMKDLGSALDHLNSKSHRKKLELAGPLALQCSICAQAPHNGVNIANLTQEELLPKSLFVKHQCLDGSTCAFVLFPKVVEHGTPAMDSTNQ